MTKVGFSLLGGLLETSGIGAMAAALAVMALPANAFAEDRGRGNWRGGHSATQTQNSGGSIRQNGRSGWRSEGSSARNQHSSGRNSRASQSQPQVQRNQARPNRWRQHWEGAGSTSASQRSPARASQDRNFRRNQSTTAQSGRIERRNGRRSDATRSSNQGQFRDYHFRHENRDNNWQRNRDSHDGDRALRNSRRGTYSSNDRERWRDKRWSESGGGDRWRDRDHSWSDRDHRWSDRDGRWRDGSRRHSYKQDHKRWDRHWRNHTRYDWRSYRSHNHHVYRIGRYYSPYHHHHYSRLRVGFFLGSLFYTSRYWIDDPWHYRLPPAYGPYRWIRYYDDALLVDIYTGEVVDVIYDFFW